MEIPDRVQFVRGLLGTKSTIQITADPNVINATRDLADVIDVIDDDIDGKGRAFALLDRIVRHKHPGIQHDA